MSQLETEEGRINRDTIAYVMDDLDQSGTLINSSQRSSVVANRR